MTKTATDWIAWLEAEPRSEPDLSIAVVLREQAAEIERLRSESARYVETIRALIEGECPVTDHKIDQLFDALDHASLPGHYGIVRRWLDMLVEDQTGQV